MTKRFAATLCGELMEISGRSRMMASSSSKAGGRRVNGAKIIIAREKGLIHPIKEGGIGVSISFTWHDKFWCSKLFEDDRDVVCASLLMQ